MNSPDHPSLPSRRRFLSGLAAVPFAATFARAAAKPAYTVGCFTRPWADLEPEGTLDAIAEAGFTVAGLMSAKGGTIVRAETPPERIRAIAAHARGRGLSVASLYAGDFLVPGDSAASSDRLRRIIGHAVTCGCPTMILGGTTNPKHVDAYYETVGACCDHAAASGGARTARPPPCGACRARQSPSPPARPAPSGCRSNARYDKARWSSVCTLVEISARYRGFRARFYRNSASTE